MIQKQAIAIHRIQTSRIQPDPSQPRKQFDPEYISGLGESIKAEGLQQPITVRAHPEKPGHYLIITGECRWRAHAHAGLQTVNCIVSTDLDGEAKRFRAQVMENVTRKDMTFGEEVSSIVKMKNFGDDNLTIGRALGLTVYRVECILKLADLSPSVWKLIDIGAIGRKIAEYTAGRVPDGDLERLLLSVAGKGTAAAHHIVNSYLDEKAQGDFNLACEEAGMEGKAKDDLLRRTVELLLAVTGAASKLDKNQRYILGRDLARNAAASIYPTESAKKATVLLSNVFFHFGTELKNKSETK